MTKHLPKTLFALAAAILAMFIHISPAAADPYSAPSVDPASSDYNPVAWNKKWTSGAAAPAGDAKAGLEAMGVIGAATPGLGPDDLASLNEKWDGGQLFERFTNLAREYYARASADPSIRNLTPEQIDLLANWLKTGTYSDLSPGLKSVVHQMAVIIQGQ